MIALVGALAALSGGGSAWAGRYHVYSCRMPDGEAAPTDGWTRVFGPDTKDDYLEDTCQTGGALVAALGDGATHVVNTDYVSWQFQAPSPLVLVNTEMWRAGDTSQPSSNLYTYQYWLAAPSLNDPFDQCLSNQRCSSQGNTSEPLAPANEIEIPGADLGTQIFVAAGCSGATELEPLECPENRGATDNYAAAIYLFAANFTLEQTAPPSVSSVGGELSTAPAIEGTSHIVFSASDPGAGIYEVQFSIDGKVVQHEVVDEDGGRCHNVGQTADGLPAFLYLQPCPATVNADMGFDSLAVPNGSHHLIVTLTDAAGNVATLLDRTIDVDNPGPPGPPNGLGASSHARLQARWASTSHRRLAVSFGHRAKIVGRLTDQDGTPIVGAQMELIETPAFVGAHQASTLGGLTGPHGEFTIRLPARLSSRSVTVAYYARIGDLRPAASTTLDLAVRAPLSLVIYPRTASAGSTIQFRGRLLAGPIPAGGKPLILEARSGSGRWIEFDVLRSDSRGRYGASYTFKFPGPVLYQFRVVCEQEADYPYTEGFSPVVTVNER